MATRRSVSAPTSSIHTPMWCTPGKSLPSHTDPGGPCSSSTCCGPSAEYVKIRERTSLPAAGELTPCQPQAGAQLFHRPLYVRDTDSDVEQVLVVEHDVRPFSLAPTRVSLGADSSSAAGPTVPSRPERDLFRRGTRDQVSN